MEELFLNATESSRIATHAALDNSVVISYDRFNNKEAATNAEPSDTTDATKYITDAIVFSNTLASTISDAAAKLDAVSAEIALANLNQSSKKIERNAKPNALRILKTPTSILWMSSLVLWGISETLHEY